MTFRNSIYINKFKEKPNIPSFSFCSSHLYFFFFPSPLCLSLTSFQICPFKQNNFACIICYDICIDLKRKRTKYHHGIKMSMILCSLYLEHNHDET